MKTILIQTSDGVNWQRFEDFEWNSHKEAEDDVEKINKITEERNLIDIQFEFVSKDYFEKFNGPYV